MKTNLVAQAYGNDINVAEAEKLVKETLKEQNVKLVSVTTLDVYIKPIEKEVYYVATLKDGSTVEGKVENC